MKQFLSLYFVFSLTLVLLLLNKGNLNVNSINLTNKLLPITPKAFNLKNHYGTEPIQNQFGPNPSGDYTLQREGTLVGEAVKPIKNFTTEINPKAVSSGIFSNTAKEASRIVSVEIAKPKALIDAEVNYETIVHTPVQTGTSVAKKQTTSMDRRSGMITSSAETISKPIMAILNTPRQVKTHIVSTVELDTGKVIPPMKLQPRVTKGINM